MSNDITPQDLARVLPANLKNMATQSLADRINNCTTDPDFADMVKDNYLSYARVLAEGKWKIDDYLSAVMFVSHRLLGKGVGDAFALVFPQRFARLQAQGVLPKDIAAHASAYNRGKLVNLIMEQSIVPFHVLNQHHRQEALAVQVDLMKNAQSEMVRTTAAANVLAVLETPKAVGPLINIDVRETSGLSELKKMLTEIAHQQQNAVAQGVTPKELAAMKLPVIEGEIVR